MSKGLSLSGGGTKLPAIAGAAMYILRDYEYAANYITGISAGAVISLPLALGLFEEVEELSVNFTFDDIFDSSPVDKNGKLTVSAIARAVLGKESLGKQNNLSETLKKIVTPKLFSVYQSNKKYPAVFVGRVGYKTGAMVYENLKECSYPMAIESINASASVPVMVESRKFKNEFWYDGGMRDHLGSHWLMERYKLSEHISVYSRPKDYDITDLNWEPKNVLTVLERTLSILNMEKSKNDEYKEDVLSKAKGIKNTKIFLPIRSDKTYEHDLKKYKELYDMGMTEAERALPKSIK